MARRAAKKNSARKTTKRYDTDEQTRKKFLLVDEGPADKRAATLSALYLLLTMFFFFWLLFDIWMEQYSLAKLIGYGDTRRLASPVFRLAAYALIGGALGATVNGIRSFLVWHVERVAFGRNFIWKYITLPWVGAALALFTYALIRSGVAIFSGDGVQNTATTGQMLAIFGSGALAGYGSHEVLRWLDFQVTRLFRIQSAIANPAAPEQKASSSKKAENILQSQRSRRKNPRNESLRARRAGNAIRQRTVLGSSVVRRNSANVIAGPLRRNNSGNKHR